LRFLGELHRVAGPQAYDRVREGIGSNREPPTSGVSPIGPRRGIGLTAEVGGFARLNHGLSPRGHVLRPKLPRGDDREVSEKLIQLPRVNYTKLLVERSSHNGVIESKSAMIPPLSFLDLRTTIDSVIRGRTARGSACT
jgi:hypothetical protein